MKAESPDPLHRRQLGKTEGLQRGFTSGTCALAASMGALLALRGDLDEAESPTVKVSLKKGIALDIPLTEWHTRGDEAGAAVIKDSGDDDDITHGATFRAVVRWTEKEGISIEGGTGIGRVTREGLSVKPGEWAINPGPRKMIVSNLEPLIPEGKGLLICLSVDEGEALARKTWNPRLGIVGGISIIGTTGVIEPRSNAAYKTSLLVLTKSRRAAGEDKLYITPGYVGAGFYSSRFALKDEDIIRFGDHAGYLLIQGAAKGFKEVHMAAHIGKMAKIAAGLFDTHCKTGDARLETVAALAGASGADSEDIRRLLSMKMAEEAVPFLLERKLDETFDLMADRSAQRIKALWHKEGYDYPELYLYVLDLKGNLLNTGTDLKEIGTR